MMRFRSNWQTIHRKKSTTDEDCQSMLNGCSLCIGKRVVSHATAKMGEYFQYQQIPITPHLHHSIKQHKFGSTGFCEMNYGLAFQPIWVSCSVLESVGMKLYRSVECATLAPYVPSILSSPSSSSVSINNNNNNKKQLKWEITSLATQKKFNFFSIPLQRDIINTMPCISCANYP